MTPSPPETAVTPTPQNIEPATAPVSLSLLALTTPVAMGYVPLGAVFGFLFVQAGGSGWMAVLSSVVVYAGAAQYLMIPMLAAGLPISAIAAAALVVNLRHVFYGLSLLDRLPAKGLARWYMVFALTDETYSVLTSLPRQTPVSRLVEVSGLNQCWWLLGTVVGAVLGARAQIPWQGMDFVLTCLFAVLAVEQWRQRASSVPLWVALLSYAIAYALSPTNALVLAIAMCVAVALFWKPRQAEVAP